MQKLLGLLFIALLLASCGQDRMSDATAMGIDPVDETVTDDKAATDEEAGSTVITATFLDDYPAEVEDCDCSLFLTDNQEDLFFVFNWNEGVGVIGINGSREVVQRGASLSQGNDKYDSYLHENGKYKVQSSLTRGEQAGDEGSVFSGKLKVTDKRNGTKTEFTVQGTCSC